MQLARSLGARAAAATLKVCGASSAANDAVRWPSRSGCTGAIWRRPRADRRAMTSREADGPRSGCEARLRSQRQSRECLMAKLRRISLSSADSPRRRANSSTVDLTSSVPSEAAEFSEVWLEIASERG
eukprot:scaffold23779_cov112-Isochrysis_galbana.AAC.4